MSIDSNGKSFCFDSEEIGNILQQVDQELIDTLQLQHINRTQFGSLISAVCNQYEDAKMLKKLRTPRENKLLVLG